MTYALSKTGRFPLFISGVYLFGRHINCISITFREKTSGQGQIAYGNVPGQLPCAHKRKKNSDIDS